MDTLGRGAVRPTGPIEPRLAARRIEVARDQGRRRLRRLVVLAVIIVVVVAAIAVTQSPLLDVDRIPVSGAGTRSAAVREASGIDAGAPMVAVDAGAAEQRITDRLSWVDEATVTLQWPDSVTIAVTRREPVAVIGDEGAALEVDAQGWAVGPESSARPLPSIDDDPVRQGERVAQAVRARAKVAGAMPASLRAEVEEIDTDASGIVVHLDDGIEVTWGDVAQSGPKADALEVLLDQADRSTIASIDVSVPRAVTLTRKTGGA